MVAGAAIVVAACVWERAVYPGLLDFSKPYRTVALFWEMHVGGAALDAYLAMAMPFVAWAVVTARTPARWTVAALLALLAEYACLTSFSRGVYLASVVGLAVFAVLRRHGSPAARSPGWRCAGVLLMALLVGEAIAIVGSDGFMIMRM